MNIHQFQYIISLAEKKHFEKAADACFISQSTLSTMVAKFEDEIGIMIFDRKKKPLEVTAEGKRIIDQIKKINKEISNLDELTQEIKGKIKGALSISVIPTIAPYLLPLFLHDFASRFSELNIEVREQTTSEILRQLKSRELDIGIISIPVRDNELIEYHLYDEPFVFFDASQAHEQTVTAQELDISNLCLLEEGHCMRTQVLELCEYHEKNLTNKLNFRYKAGSIDSLLRFVRSNQASTLLPWLAAMDLNVDQQQHVSRFSEPVPFRTIGLVVHRHFVKHKILDMLRDDIKAKIAGKLPAINLNGKQLLPV
jgi:LysR family hydrogen peroxide-inducible transcriptional activator